MADINYNRIKPSEIEKKSLDAHTELCAERYNQLNTKLDTMDRRIDGIEGVLIELRDQIMLNKEQRNKQIIRWVIGFIGFLGTFITGLIFILINMFV